MGGSFTSGYLIPGLTVAGALFSVIGTYYVLRSVLLQRKSGLSQAEKLEAYIYCKFDIKWPSYFILSFLTGMAIAILTNTRWLYQFNLIILGFFILLLWGNIRILKERKKYLNLLSAKQLNKILFLD